MTYADIAGLEGRGSGDISGPLLNQLSQMDGFVHVVRCFEDPTVPHPLGKVDPLRDLEAMDGEFLLNDLITVERKLQRLAEERQKGARDKQTLERERALFEKLHAALGEEIPLRDVPLSPEERKMLAGFGLLSIKPVLVLFNLGEGQTPPQVDYPHQQSSVMAMQGKLEMEIAQLDPEDAALFMAEYGIEELALSRVIRRSYALLGLISFFTVGEDEVRAWTVRRGAKAPEAAGVIHSDMEKGFIRAEVVAFEDLVAAGSLAAARAQGKLRLEGKDYEVQDGDILHIRFNVGR